MNYRAVIHMMGKLIFLEGIFMTLPLVVALIYGESETYLSFIIPIFIMLALGALFGIKKPKNNMLLAKEGFVICGLVWILLSALGCIPFVISGMIPNYLDAFFETVSGFTTTGSTVLTVIEKNPKGLLFWRSFTNWIGGMGVLTFFMAIVPQAEGQSMHLMRAEVPGPKAGKLVSKMTDAFRILYIIYIALTVMEIIMLMFSGIGFYHSVVTAFSTAGTGGFSVKDASIAGYHNPYVEYVCATFMLLFGVNFNLYFFMVIRKFKAVIIDEELRVYLCVVFGSVALMMINLMLTTNIDTEKAFRDSYFTVTTFVSSCGFVTADYEQWHIFSKALIYFLMLAGAMSGSTGGGIKETRVILYFKEMIRDLKQMLRPRQVMSVRINKKGVDNNILKGVNTYLIIYIFIVVVSVMLISVEGNNFETNFSAVFSCFNNMGPGMDKVGATQNYAHLGPLTKLVLCFDMLAGRLEIYPIILLLIPATWKKH